MKVMKSGSGIPCKFKDYLKIDIHDWMTIRILLCYLLTFDSNVASVGGPYEVLQ